MVGERSSFLWGARVVQGVGGNSARYLMWGDVFLNARRGVRGAFRKKILDGGVGFRKRLLLGLGVVGERLSTFMGDKGGGRGMG